MLIDVPRVAAILGGERALGRCIRTLDDLAAAVDEGLPVAALERAVAHVAGDGPEATDLKHAIVPKTTLQRRHERLSAEESQRLERLARLAALAEEVWEGAPLDREFLTNPQPQLAGERPIDMIRSDLATRRVERILYGLEYSLPV